MITPAVKDKVLASIITEDNTILILEYRKVFPNQEISVNEFFLVLEQFVKLGLLKKVSKWGAEAGNIYLTADIYDFYQHGGFTAQEELLQANMEKLSYELSKLAEEANPANITRINTLTGIAASITTALGLFTR